MPLPILANLRSALTQNARTLGLLYWMMLVSSIGNAAMMSLFPAIGRESNIPDTLMVSVQSVSAFLSVIFSPYWAGRSDRVGRKPIILVGSAGFFVASLLTGVAVFLATHHIVAPLVGLGCIMASRCVFGTFGLASNPAIQAYVADHTTREQRTGVLASMTSAQGLGSIIGPAIAPLLLLPLLGLAGPQLVFGLLGLALWIIVARYLPGGRPAAVPAAAAAGGVQRRRTLSVLRQANVWPFVLYMAILSSCGAANMLTLGFVVIDTLGMDPTHAQPYAGAAMMAGAIVSLLVQLVLIRAFRLMPPRLMTLGAALAVAGNVLMAVSQNYLMVAAAFALANFGYAFARPGVAAGASLAASREQQGAVAGMVAAAGSSGLMIAPVLAMMLYQFWRAGPFLGIALLMGAAGAMAAMNRYVRQASPKAATAD